MMKKQTIRIHRVGSVTFGIVLLVIGGLSLVQLILPAIGYQLVIRAWPLIFIILGIEVLLSNRHKTYEVLGEDGKVMEQEKIVYDFPAVFLVIVLILFAMVLAAITYEGFWI